jgi:hypothetical protein
VDEIVVWDKIVLGRNIRFIVLVDEMFGDEISGDEVSMDEIS